MPDEIKEEIKEDIVIQEGEENEEISEDEEIETLKYIFDNINRWLSHAEGKQGALLAANIVIVTTLGISITTFPLFIVIILQLKSFLPNYKVNICCCQKREKNLIFYYDIATNYKNEYIEDIKKKYNLKISNKFSKDLCEEIVENSKICVRKYKSFETVLKCEIWALIFIGIIEVFIGIIKLIKIIELDNLITFIKKVLE